MPRLSLVTVLLGTFLAMAALYGLQPLLPLFSRYFAVSEAESATLITWSLLSMGVGPLFMGLLLQRYSPRRLMAACFIGLGLSEVLFAAIDVFVGLKAIRFLQGALVSALLAATMTYISATARNMRQVMAYYVSAAVAGGLCGRIVAGFISQYFSWRVYFVAIAIAFAGAALVALRLPAGSGVIRMAFSLRRLFSVLRDGLVIRLYAIVFLGFFSLTAVLNFAPFRLESLDESLGEATISLFYLGFVVGFFVSTNAPRLADLAGGPLRAVGLGVVSVVGGLVVAAISSVSAVFIAITLVTCGFFLQHATIAALLNSYAADRAGDVNSLYVAVYYVGGTAGSYLPGLVYISLGWLYFVGLLLAIVSLSMGVAWQTHREGRVFQNVS